MARITASSRVRWTVQSVKNAPTTSAEMAYRKALIICMVISSAL